MTDRTVRVVIRGRVQGVGFRDWTVRTARDLGLAGFVRNRRDGTVEAVFQGSVDAVERMLGACRQGPPSAWVELLLESDVPVDVAGTVGFRLAPTE